jgi:hypothetical protein
VRYQAALRPVPAPPRVLDEWTVLGNRRIAIGSEMGLEIYAYEENGLVRIAESTERRSQPIALLPTSQSGRFAVVSQNGVIEWFEV